MQKLPQAVYRAPGDISVTHLPTNDSYVPLQVRSTATASAPRGLAHHAAGRRRFWPARAGNALGGRLLKEDLLGGTLCSTHVTPSVWAYAAHTEGEAVG